MAQEPMRARAQTRTRTEVRPLVCVIEDDGAIREVLRDLLEGEGYRVVEAGDGQAGCAILRESKERLVVLVDHKMPVMDGCDVLELAARDEELRARHAFILVTASPKHAEEDCGVAMEETGTPLLPKPFEIDEVLEAVMDAAARLPREP